MRNEVKLANPNYDSSKIEEFKNVWVFCEQRQGQMMSTSYELISEGRKLADELGVKLCGLLVGDNVAISPRALAATALMRSSSATTPCSRTTPLTPMPRSSATSSPR